MSRYGNDPHWIDLRFETVCDGCGKTLKRGDKVFYYPIGKTILCAGDDCGSKDSREFASAAFDEMSNRSM